MQSNPSCPNCTRNFRGLQGQGSQERSHERGGILPLLLRCGHTFCTGCLSKLVKIQKTNITCPQCQSNTPMPFGEASLKSLPPDYYRLGQVVSNYKQLNDLIQQKMESAAKPATDRKMYEGKLLKACPGRELCQECRRALSTCSCRQCDNATMCNNCFERVHCGSKMMQSHIQRPFTKDRCIAKCPDHGEEEKYFCTEDDVAICGHCAIIGSHKGHNIEPISEQCKEAFTELGTALDKGVASLKKLYYGRQAVHKAKDDARKETGTILETVSNTFATQISLLQMRAHHILELVHNNCTDQLDRLSEMEANSTSNIAILEGTIEDASHAIKTDNDTDGNLLRMVETLTSTDLPCYYYNPEGRPPMAAFTYDKEFSARIVNFGSVGVDNSPRGDLLSESELPEDYEEVEIKDEILKQSSVFSIDKKGTPKIKALSEEPERNLRSPEPERDLRTPVTESRKPERTLRTPVTESNAQSRKLERNLRTPVTESPHTESRKGQSAPVSRRSSAESTGKASFSRGTTPPKGNRRNYGVMADPKIELSPYHGSAFTPSESWLKDQSFPDEDNEYKKAPEVQDYPRAASSKQKSASHAYTSNRAYERASNVSPRTSAFQPETKALVRLVHIRNPCYFFVQREADHQELGTMMTRINTECNRLRESERKPENIGPGLICCAKYVDNRWYRARIKRFVEPALPPPKKPHHKDSKKSKRKKSARSSDAESSKDESEDKASVKDENEEAEKEGNDATKKEDDVSTVNEENKEMESGKDEASEKKEQEAARNQESDDNEDVEIDVEVSSEHSVKSTQSIKSTQSAKSSHSTKSSHSAKSTQSAKSSQGEAPSKEAAVELMVEVVYMDFGNTETVPVTKLCKLRTKLQRCPDMAICCSLVDIVPNNYEGKWTAEVNQGFAKMVGQSIVQMSVQASAGALLYVDLHKLPNEEVENDMPVSIRDALVFFELACFKTPESMPKDTWRQSRSYLGADLPKSGESISATISHINNPGSFYVQELGDDLEYLLAMMKDLQAQYKKRDQERWGIICPQVGMICVAKFELDSQWYRAQIIGLPGKQLVELVYVDYGNLDTVHCSNLRKVTNEFLKLPVQALPCSLADVEPVEDPADGWPQHVAGAFFEVVAQKTLKVIVKSIKDGCLSTVLLYEDEEDEKEVCANAELVRGGNATSTGPSSTVLPFGAQGDTPKSKVLKTSHKKKQINGAVSPGVGQSKASAKKHAAKSKASSAKTESSKSKAVVNTKVHVSHIESPACIYVQLATAGKDGLDSLLEAMTLHYKDSEPEDCVWQEGDICCALLVRENVWCRAKIKTVLPEEKAVVLFSDYGNTEIIDLANVRPLEERFQQAPPFAIQCHLADVIPAGDKHKWTKTACEFLIAKLADLECCIVKKGELVAGSLPIDLLYEMSIEEKLEREITDDLFSISKLLKQKGLAFAPRKPRAKGHSRSASPTGKKSPGKTSPKLAIMMSNPILPAPASQTVPESTQVNQGPMQIKQEPVQVKQEPVQKSIMNGADQEQQLAIQKETLQDGDSPAMQAAQLTQNTSEILLDTVERSQEDLTDVPSTNAAITMDSSEYKVTQEQENITSSQPDATQNIVDSTTEVPSQNATFYSHNAPVSSEHDVPVVTHPVTAVKRTDPAMQPLPASADSDSDFMSDSGPSGEGQTRKLKKKAASPGKLAEELNESPENQQQTTDSPLETIDISLETSDTLLATDIPSETTEFPPEITESQLEEPIEPVRRLSPPVVVLDSSTSTDAIGYKPRPPPSTDVVQLVVTFVNNEGVIFGVEVEEVENLQKLTTKLQTEMAARPPGTDLSFYKGQPVCANFAQDGLWYRAKVLGGTQQGVKVQYIDFGNIELTAPDKIQPIAFEPDIPQKSQGCKLIDLYPKEPDTDWPKATIDILLGTLLEQTCVVQIKSLCSEDKPWKVDLKLPNGDSLRQLLLDHGYAQGSGESSSSMEEIEEVESEEETGDGSSGISSTAGATTSDAPSQITQSDDVVRNSDPRQIVAQDIVADEEEKEDEVIDIRKYILAGTGIQFKNMRLPDEGVYFGAQVTQVDQPDLLYIQIVPSPTGNSDPIVHRSAEELFMLGELIKELNRMAPELPRLPTVSMKPGQVCCALYDLDLMYYRGKILGVREQGEKLVQVQYVDYGNSDWHSPDSLRQIPDKFVNLPAQARKCRIVGIRPPKEIPEGDTLLLDTDWPVSSGKRMVELVNNKQLVAVLKYDGAIPGIQLFDSASDIPMRDPQPADGMPLHVRLVSDQLAELDTSEEGETGKNQESEV